MATASTTSLVDALRQYHLLEAAQLEELKSVQGRFADPRALAGELIRRGWLSPYQANHLLTGRGQDLLLGSYVLLERLGEGGMGQVFKARNWKLGKVVALKVIRKERLDSPDAVRRFEREVRAAAALSHPNIVHAYDADQIGGTHLLVMEHVEGGTDLARLVKANGPLSVAQACEYVRQAALGLQHAHERGLVHRDVKPQNLLLGTDAKVVKVLDMGLARLDHTRPDDRSSTVTQEGAVMGTPDYIAPEQALESHTVDIRADLYSLGCTLYFLLTGRVPFPGGSLTEKLLKHQMHQPRPVEELRPEVPPTVAAVVRKLMAKAPADRYQTPAELAATLAGLSLEPPAVRPACGDGRPVSADHPELVATAAGDTTSQALDFRPSEEEVRREQEEQRQRRRKEKRVLVAGLGAGVVLVGLAGGLLALLQRPARPTVSPGTAGGRPEEDEGQKLDRWVRRVAALPPGEQVKAVAEELKKRNPDFNGELNPVLDGGKVRFVSLPADEVGDLTPVRAFPDMISLDCFGSAVGKGQVASLEPLRGLRLTRLMIWSNPRLGSLKPLLGMPLRELNCNCTAVADLSPLRDMPLEELQAAGIPIRSLEPLRGLPLCGLNIDNTAVASLDPLKGMKLRYLYCGGTRVSDLSPLAGMPLTDLNCGLTPVANLSPLKDMKLTRLLCWGARVTDLSPLKGMPLTELSCEGTQVTDLSPLRGMPLKELHCDFKPDRDADVLRSLGMLEKINGKPAKQFWEEVGPGRP
jgi:serine/threonine protein kinase